MDVKTDLLHWALLTHRQVVSAAPSHRMLGKIGPQDGWQGLTLVGGCTLQKPG